MPPKHLSALLCSNQNMSDSLGLQVSWVVVHRTGQGQGCLAAHIQAPLMLLPLLFAAGLARNPDQPWDCMQVAQTVSSCCMPCSYFNSVRRRLDMHYTSPSARTTSRVCKTAGTGSPENYHLQVAWSQRHITYLLGDSFASRQALYVSFVM